MTPRRIIVATLGSLGDLHPMIALAQGLRTRGHDVAIATTEFYRSKIEAAGLKLHPLRPAIPPDDTEVIRRVMHPLRGPKYLIRRLLLPHLRPMVDDLLRATQAADYLVAGEIVFAAPIVAQLRGLAWGAVILAPFSLFSVHDAPVLSSLPFFAWVSRAPPAVQRAIFSVVARATRSWNVPINTVRSSLNLRHHPHPILQDRISPHLNLALFSAVMGAPQSDWPVHTVQTGFLFHDHEVNDAGHPDLEAFLEAGPPPIVFTLGSAAVRDARTFFAASAAAAQRLQRRAVLIMGDNPRPAGVPESIFCVDYAPYSQVFPKAACVVHQGGIGTTAQALRAGVPQLVMPYAFDQPDNGARLERLGLAVTIRRAHYRAGTAATRLLELLNTPDYRTRARDFGRRVEAEDGLKLACDAVEQSVAGGWRQLPVSV